MNFKMLVKTIKIGIVATLLIGRYAIALPPELEQSIKRYVAKSPMVAGLQTEIEFLDTAPNLQSCPEKIEISMQPGTRLWGRSNLELRCNKLAWTYNLAIKVRVLGDYVVANRYLQFGVKLAKGDLNVVRGDLAELPDDVLRNPKDAYDRLLTRSIQMGMKIGLNDLKEAAVISIGDPVRVLVYGQDFEVTGDGVAESAGMIGDTVRVKLYDGQAISGKVRSQGVVVVRTQ
jgi:flagella basal body P-ring formation protein FlgA